MDLGKSCNITEVRTNNIEGMGDGIGTVTGTEVESFSQPSVYM